MKKITTAFLLGSVAMLCAAGAAQAQTVYRIVGADGKVTFSDKPPVDVQQGKIATTGVGAAATSANSSLPFELRQIATKYPVVLYTSSSCAPCDSGRTLLNSRGVPFKERTIITNEDRAALQRQMGDTSLPYLTVGGQRIRGMSESEWTQYLDAAGYPKTSKLPVGYQRRLFRCQLGHPPPRQQKRPKPRHLSRHTSHLQWPIQPTPLVLRSKQTQLALKTSAS